jgi:hypothetical protein
MHVRNGDLRDPRHRAIYAAITGAAGSANDRGGWLRGKTGRAGGQQVRDAVAYLDALVGTCPEPGHLASYAAMITGARPGLAAQGQAGADEQLASADSWLVEKNVRPRHRGRAASAADEQRAPSGNVLADREIAGLASELRPIVVSRIEAARPALAAQRVPVSGADGGDAGALAGARGTSERPGVNRESLQRLVLADLMRRPGDGRSAVARIPVEMFTAGPLRQLYELVSERIVARQAVDPVIIAWEAGRRYGMQPAAGAPAGWSLPAIALRVGATPTARGTARVFGRALLADHVLSERFGAGWTQEPEFSMRLHISSPEVAGPEGWRLVAGQGAAPPRLRAQEMAPGGRAREPVPGATRPSAIQRPEGGPPGGQGWNRRAPGTAPPGDGAAPRR